MEDLEYHFYQELRSGQISRRTLLRSACSLGLVLASSRTSFGQVASRHGGIARLGVIAPTSDIDPVTGISDGSMYTAQAAAEYLCYPRPDYTLDPRLATQWHSVDARTWSFRIRQGVQWQDGSRFTADDVVASFDRLTDPAVNSGSLAAFDGILSKGNIERVADDIVVFHLDRAYVNFPYLTSAFNYNAVILPKHYEVGSGSFVKGGIGTGPFILRQFSQEQAAFSRNPHYWKGGQPFLDGLVLKFFEDSAPMVLALQGGALEGITTLPSTAVHALLHEPGIRLLQNDSSAHRAVHMRVDTGIFIDKRIRQALATCLNRDAMVLGIFGNRALVGNDHGFAPVFADSVLTSQIPQRKQDYRRARRLIAEAGYPSGLSVILTTEQYLEIPQFAVYIKEQAQRAGFDVKLSIEPQYTYYGSGQRPPWLEVPLGITDWTPRGDPSDLITPVYSCKASWNSAHWCNRSFDRLLRQYDGELDQQRRRQLALQLARIQHDEVPYIIAYWIRTLRAVTRTLHGLAAGPEFLDPGPLWLSASQLPRRGDQLRGA